MTNKDHLAPNTPALRQAILDYIRQYTARHNTVPSYRQIMAAVGLSAASALHYHLNVLQREGYITHEEGAVRALTVVRKTYRTADMPRRRQTVLIRTY